MPAQHDSYHSLKKCPFCGKEISKTAYRCPYCGQSLAELDQRQWEEQLPDSVLEKSKEPEQASTIDDVGSNPFLTMIIIGAVVILAVVISFWLFSERNAGEQDLSLPMRAQSPSSSERRKRIQEPPKLVYPESTAETPSSPAEARAGAVLSPQTEKTTGVPSEPEPSVFLVAGEVNLSELTPGKTQKSVIKAKLGEPDLESGRLLDYNWKYGLEFHMAGNGVLEEIRINSDRFKGRISPGISITSTRDDIFAAFGEPVDEVFGEDLFSEEASFTSGVLYRDGDFGRITYRKAGVTFWFNRDRVIQIGIGRKS